MADAGHGHDSAVRDPARLAALAATGLLDTGPEEAFDRLTRLACDLLGVPVSLVSLVDAHRQYFKSVVGLPEPWASSRETPLSHSVCRHVVAQDAPLAVPDSHEVEALRGNGAVDELGVRAYAGVPIRGPEGEVYGSFCVIDSVPRRWTAEQLRVVEQLGAAAAAEIELRGRVLHLLLHDRVTGLPNRDQLLGRVGQALRSPDGYAAVLAIDVPNLAVVNDSLGRAGGDRLLVGIAARLRTRLPAQFLCRIEEARFGMLDAPLAVESDAFRCIDTVRDALGEPFRIDGHDVHVRPNIGLAVGEPGDDPEEVVSGAVAALRRARQDPALLRAHGATLRQAATERLRMESALRLALQREALEVAYQPKVRLGDGVVVGAEALVRWNDPELGAVPPSTFIPLAELSGLIAPLGQHVLRTACRQAADWRRAHPGLDLQMAVNLSTHQLQVTDVASLVYQVLDETGLPARALTLELTESALVEQGGRQLSTLRALAEMGVALDLDDFGTGYSSLSYLATLPLDVLKIDRSFVRDLHDPRVKGIATAILSMAAALNLGVVAEGIETEAQRDELLRLGCPIGQGYLFSPPRPAEALDDLLAAAARGRPLGPPRATG